MIRSKRDILGPWFLGFSAILSIVSLTMLSPALPAMEIYFRTTPEMMQNLISMNMFISALFVLIFGALSQSYGRKFFYLIGISLLFFGALGSALSSSLLLLFLAQGVQSIGTSACSVIPLVILKEVYPGVRGTKILSAWGIIMPMAPAIAGSIGGVLTQMWSWHSIFILFALCASVLWVGISVVIGKSTSVTTHPPFSLKRHLHSFQALLLDKRYRSIAILPGLGFAGLSAYTTTAPFVFIEKNGMSPSGYGLLLFVTFFGMVGGSLFVRSFVERWALSRFIKWGVAVMILSGFFFVSAGLLNSMEPIGFSLIMMVYGLGFGMVLTSSTSLALDFCGDKKGHGAALLRCVQFIFIAGGVFIAGYIYNGSFLWAAFLILGFAGLSGLGVWKAKLK